MERSHLPSLRPGQPGSPTPRRAPKTPGPAKTSCAPSPPKGSKRSTSRPAATTPTSSWSNSPTSTTSTSTPPVDAARWRARCRTRGCHDLRNSPVSRAADPAQLRHVDEEGRGWLPRRWTPSRRCPARRRWSGCAGGCRPSGAGEPCDSCQESYLSERRRHSRSTITVVTAPLIHSARSHKRTVPSWAPDTTTVRSAIRPIATADTPPV